MAAINSNLPIVREAYLIGGHGTEDTRYSSIVLPDNVYVVVKAKAGESTMGEDNLDMKLCELPDEVLQNPEKYPEMIYDAIGSFFLYKPGDECPNFKFSTVNAYLDSDIPTVRSNLSGIMNTSSIKKQYTKDKTVLRYVYPRNELAFVKDMFTNDNYSFKQQSYQKNGKWSTKIVGTDIITECAEHDITLRNEIVSKEELVDTIYRITDLDVYNTTMYNILFTFGETELRTHGGVFYHLVCRYREGVSHKLYGTPTSFNNVATREPIIINHVPSRKKDPELYKLIQDTISNAEKMKSYTQSIMTRKKKISPQLVSPVLSISTKQILYKKPVNKEKYITNIAIKIMMHVQQHVHNRSTKNINIAKLVIYLVHHGITTKNILFLFKKIDELLSYYKRNESLYKRMHSALLTILCEVCVALLYNKWSISQVNLLLTIMIYDETYYKKDPRIEKKVLECIESHYVYR
jgi:hypothetical protein